MTKMEYDSRKTVIQEGCPIDLCEYEDEPLTFEELEEHLKIHTKNELAVCITQIMLEWTRRKKPYKHD